MIPKMIVKQPDSELVQPQYQNDIILASTYIVEAEAKSKLDQSHQLYQKSFPYQIISEERRSYMEQEVKKTYHHMLKSSYDRSIPDFKCLIMFQQTAPSNWVDQPVQDQVYENFNKSRSVGCGHYIRGCQIMCEVCEKFFPCRVCHDDELDHEFPRYETKTVKCNYCEHQQPISQFCEQCHQSFGNYYCEKCKLVCGLGDDAKPNYHCDKCQMCMVGLREMSQHCDKCNSCFNKKLFAGHTCVKEKGDCIVCLGELGKTIYGRVVLNCKHQLHSHCYHQLLNAGIFKCPICKRFMPTDQDKSQIIAWMTRNYRRVFIPFEMDDYIVKVKCNDCLLEFPQNAHPLYYFCPKCNLFNCEKVGELEGLTQKQINQILNDFQTQWKFIVKPRRSIKKDVLEVICDVYEFKNQADAQKSIGIEINNENAVFVATLLNKMPSSVDALKELIELM